MYNNLFESLCALPPSMESVLTEKRPDTVLRTFRLSAALESALAKDAARKKIGKNALVTSILNKYVEWDSIVSEFGYLYLPYEILGSLIATSNKDTLAAIAKQSGKKVASTLGVWFGSADLDSILNYMDTSVKYSGAHLKQRIEKEGNVVRIIVYQPFDENGATFVRAFNTALIESVLGYPPKIIEKSNSIETIIEVKD
jgi:hypothetical protein